MRRLEAATSAWGAANQTDVNDIYIACLSTNAITSTSISNQSLSDELSRGDNRVRIGQGCHNKVDCPGA